MKLHFITEGTPNSPVLVLSNSLGSTWHMWDNVVPYLLPYFRVVRYDTRGHGQNEHWGHEKESWQIADLGQDVLHILDQLAVEKAYFCGLSMGGLVGQWLGIHHPERLHALALCNTGAQIGDETRWNTRIQTIQTSGMNAIVHDTLERWFTPAFRTEHPEEIARFAAMFTASPMEGYARCCGALRDANFRNQIAQIPLKTWVVTGSDDPVTDVHHAQFLADHIPQATMTLLPVRHLSAAESPKLFVDGLLSTWIGDSPAERGMHIRRTVLGNTHVDRAIAQTNDLSADFQSFITQYAWGEIWARPGLAKPTRSLITVAMLIALNRKNELLMHFRAAIHNGVTRDELKEVILQSGIYCGLPAANDALHLLQEFDINNPSK